MLQLELVESAYRLTTEVIGVSRNDSVLVVTDAAKLNVGKAFASVCRSLGAETVLAMMPMTGEHGNEPPATIAAAMRAADIVFAPTTHAVTHTQSRLEAAAAGTRVVILRGVDEDMLIRGAMAGDFKEIRSVTAKVAEALTGTDSLRVTSEAGTNVTFSIRGRSVFRLDGFFQEAMGFAALPGGEVPTSPVEGTAQGTIVFDYSMDGIGRLDRPVRLEVNAGKVVSVDGSSADIKAIEAHFAHDENARNIAEFAVGTNPYARLIGNLAEDKKLLGTVHFAIGDNKSLGGGVESSIHLDGLMIEPTVVADGNRIIVRSGKLMI